MTATRTAITLVAAMLFCVMACVTPASAAEPQTLDEAVESIKAMYDSGGYTRIEIARELSRIVDQRVRNANTAERMQDSRNWKPWLYGTEGDPEKGLDHARQKSSHFDHENAAKWVWRSRYGACEECACLSYYILKRAGVDENVRIVSSSAGSSGHNFVVWGMKDGAKSGDARTWGETAYVVDGWQGRAFTPADAHRNRYIGDSGRSTMVDRTKAHDKEASVWRERDDAASFMFDPEMFCFVATAVYGGPDGRELAVLRGFRDDVLARSGPGRAFITWYYRNGPAAAAVIERRPWLRTPLRMAVFDPLVEVLDRSAEPSAR